MLKLELDLLPRQSDCDVAVVIDVLRMTTTAAILFERGLDELAVVADLEEARDLAGQMGALLLGERGGRRLPGFAGGNSPLEYLNCDLTGKKAILCTSNGSSAVETLGGSNHLLLGAIVNAGAVARTALSLAQTGIRLVCAGTDGQVSLDDVCGAALIAREIQRRTEVDMVGDGAKLVMSALGAVDDLREGLLTSRHGQYLEAIGLGPDIAFAASPNTLETVPQRAGLRPACFIGARVSVRVSESGAVL